MPAGQGTTTVTSHNPSDERSTLSVNYATLHNPVMQMLPLHAAITSHVSASAPPAAAHLTITPGFTAPTMTNVAPAATATPALFPMSASASLQMTSVNSTSNHSVSIPTYTTILQPGFPLPGVQAPEAQLYGHQTVNNPQQVLWQSHFGYDQVVCIHLMMKRWHFYIATKDAFPSNLNLVRKVTIAYATGILHMSHEVLAINQRMFDLGKDHYLILVIQLTIRVRFGRRNCTLAMISGRAY